MIESLEGISATNKSLEGVNSPFELSDSQLQYLKELNVSSEQWEGMDIGQKNQCLSSLNDRFEELGISDNSVIESTLQNNFSPELVEAYNRLEMAPNDMEQIEQVSDTLSEMSEFQIENWERMDLNERIEALNTLESRIAEIEHRPACPVYSEYMGSVQIQGGHVYGRLGGFNPETKDITLNSEMLASNDPAALRETLDTIVHEGRHAYQDYNVNECEVHPRHAEIISWSETMEGGKWGYCGGSSTLLGQRLYEQQSIEIDARNFAADVLDKYDEKFYA